MSFGFGEWVFGDCKFFDNVSADEVFLNDAFEDGWIALGVPCAFRVDDGDGALLANAEAVCFGTEDTALLAETECAESEFKVVPCFK